MTHVPDSNDDSASSAPLQAAILLYCRAGFEKECAAEISYIAASLGAMGHVRAKPDSGYVLFVPNDGEDMALLRKLRWHDLVFARQLLFAVGLVTDLPVADRIPPLLAAAKLQAPRYSALLAETADTNEAKEVLGFCGKFAKPFGKALTEAGMLVEDDLRAPRLHLFFLGSGAAWVAQSRPGNSSPWAMGIPRLRLFKSAPSRSALKLAEAFLSLMTEDERETRLKPGMKAVDLGASPGGWTWQLVQRSIHVMAIDNGPMDPALLESGAVRHQRVDGFSFRPKKAVDWMVCDMVEKPALIARLVSDWIADGHARDCIFNLKLPMKKRFEEMERCRDIIAERLENAGVRYDLRLKHLYHDREEITGYLYRIGEAGR